MDKGRWQNSLETIAFPNAKRLGRLLLSASCAAFIAFGVVSVTSSDPVFAGTVKAVKVHSMNNWSVGLDPSKVQDGAVCSMSRKFFKGYDLFVTRDKGDVVSLILVPPSATDKWYGNIMSVSIVSDDETLEAATFVPRTKRFAKGEATVPEPNDLQEDKVKPRSFGSLFGLEDKKKDKPQNAGSRLEYVLERHVSFYEGFMDDAYIEVEMERLSYRITLESFKDAMQLLEGCTITKTGRVSEFEQERLDNEVKEFYRDNPSLLPDLIRKGSDRSNLLASAKDEMKDKEEKVVDTDMVKSLTGKIIILEREKEALRSRVEAMEDSDLGKIRDKTLFAKEKDIYEKQMSYLNKQIEALLQENSKVRQSKIQYKEIIVPANKAEMEATRNRLSSLETQNSKLRGEIEAMKNSTKKGVSEESKNKIKALEDELALLDKLNKRLSKRQEIMDILIANNIDDGPLSTDKDILDLVRKSQSLYSDTEDMDNQYQEQARVNVLARMSEDLVDQLTDIEVEVMEVKEQNTALSKQNASLIEENKLLLEDINKLSEDYKSLEKRIAAQKDSLDVPVTPDANITKMTYDSLGMYKDLDGFDVGEIDENQSKQLTNMENQVRALTQQNSSLVNELDELSDQTEQIDIANNGNILLLQDQIRTLQDENSNLRDAVLEAPPVQDKEDGFNPQHQLTDRIKTLNNQNMALVSEIGALKDRLHVEKQRALTSVMGSITPQDLAERDEQIDKQQSEIDALIKENDQLKLKIDNIASQPLVGADGRTCSNANMRQANNRIATLTHTNRMLSNKINELEAGVRPKKDDILKAMPQLDPDFDNSSLKAKTASQDIAIAELRAENTRLKEMVRTAEKNAQNAVISGSCGSNQSMDIEEKIYLLEQENDRLKSRLDEVQ